MADQEPTEGEHSERALTAMEVYLCEAVYDMQSHKIAEPLQSGFLAAYMQGAAAIQSAELIAQALDRLAAAITLTSSRPCGTV